MRENLLTMVKGTIKIEQERVKLLSQHTKRFLSLKLWVYYTLFPYVAPLLK